MAWKGSLVKTHEINSVKTTDAQRDRISQNYTNTKEKLFKTTAATCFNKMLRTNRLTPKYIHVKVSEVGAMKYHVLHVKCPLVGVMNYQPVSLIKLRLYTAYNRRIISLHVSAPKRHLQASY